MDIKFRQYIQADLHRCAELSVNAWPIVLMITDKENANLFMKAYVELSLLSADYSKVCCDNGRVVGFLLGSIQEKNLTNQEKKIKRKLLRRFITGKYGRIKKIFHFLFAFILSEIKVKIFCSKFDGELVLFVVDKEYQGLGIGRKLLADFLSHASDKNLKTVYLYTDIESNWRFYEKYGFNKFREFHDNGLSVMVGKRITQLHHIKR